eukprot:gene28419-35268_t
MVVSEDSDNASVKGMGLKSSYKIVHAQKRQNSLSIAPLAVVSSQDSLKRLQSMRVTQAQLALRTNTTNNSDGNENEVIPSVATTSEEAE